MKFWKEIGKIVILIMYLVEEVLFFGECLLVMVLCLGWIYCEYVFFFVDNVVNVDFCEVKKEKEFFEIWDEIFNMIWEMEEEIMGCVEVV